jgi:hypothetical protein
VVADPTYGDSAKEGLRAARRNILEGVRDDVQRRLAPRKSELKFGAKDSIAVLTRRGSRFKKMRSDN